MPFCIRCGRKLKSSLPLCDLCLAHAHTQTEDPPKGALMVLCGDRSMGIFKRVKAYAVFFNDQIVIAHISKERERAEGRALLRAMKQKDHHILQNVISRFNLWLYYGQRYYDMNVQSILNEDPANFALAHEEVSEFYFKASQEDAEADVPGSWIGEIVLRSDYRETVDMSHNYRDTNYKIKEVLSGLYTDRLDYRESGAVLVPSMGQVYDNRKFC